MPREALKTSASKPGVISVPELGAERFGARDHFLRVGNVDRRDPVHHLGGGVDRSIRSAPTLKILRITPFASVAILEKFALLKNRSLQTPGFQQRVGLSHVDCVSAA